LGRGRGDILGGEFSEMKGGKREQKVSFQKGEDFLHAQKGSRGDHLLSKKKK